MKILGTLSYTWVLSLEDLTCLTVLCFALKCSQFGITLNFRSETLLLMEMIHQALGFHGPTLKSTGRNQENKAVILKMLPQGPYLGERTQAKKYLIINQNNFPLLKQQKVFLSRFMLSFRMSDFPCGSHLGALQRSGGVFLWFPKLQDKLKVFLLQEPLPRPVPCEGDGPALPMAAVLAAEQWEVLGFICLFAFAQSTRTLCLPNHY